jgi:hypothetical protein
MRATTRGAVATAAALLATAAGALTGVGSPAAQAYVLSYSPDFVRVHLSSDEVGIARVPGVPDHMCRHDLAPVLSGVSGVTFNEHVCFQALVPCLHQTPLGRSATVTWFRHGSVCTPH